MKQKSKRVVAGVLTGLALAHVASGSLVLFEGFDIAAADGAGIAGLTGGSSVGLSGAWGSVNAGSSSATYASSGLSFAGMPTSGGALLMTSTGSDGNVNAYRQVSGGISSGGSLYGSFLFQTQAVASRYLALVGVETGAATNFASNPITPHRLGDNDDPFRFNILADGWNSADVLGTNGLKVRRWNANGSLAFGGGTGNLANGETYLAVFRIQPAFVDGDPLGVNQSAVVWFLDNAQFQALDMDNLTEAALDAAHVSKASLGDGYQGGLSAGQYLNIAALAAGGTGTNTTIFDEIRMGTSLQAVVVPEPSTYAVLLGIFGLAICLVRRRKS